ncbi:hypothetical protein PV518_45300, partial [Streptomyces sp. ND04-05B]|uniref:hypothetical protein n=1 Tax=Streptomyces sp. ND04-05B TaxID=3028693 RepID=UPI0029BE2106
MKSLEVERVRVKSLDFEINARESEVGATRTTRRYPHARDQPRLGPVPFTLSQAQEISKDLYGVLTLKKQNTPTQTTLPYLSRIKH